MNDKAPHNWETKTLDKVYEFRSGLSKPASEFGSGYPFLTFKDVFYNYFAPDPLGDLVQSTDRERATCDIHRGDVFLTRTSETMDDLGMSCVALKDYPEATFNGFSKRLRPIDQSAIDPAYAGYYFRSRDFRVAVTAMSTLSTRASLNNEMLARLTIRLPDSKTQQAIGSVLLALDDKIELNRRMNRTLEQMAAAIFKAWFVDFEPVRAKASGAASFPCMAQSVFDALPATFADSELGPIPDGWEVKSLDEIADYLNGLALQKYPVDDGPSLPRLKIAQLRKGDTEGAELSNSKMAEKYIVRDGDVIFSWSGSLLVKLWTGGDAALNQHLFKVTSERYPQWLYYLWTAHHLDDFQRTASSKATTMGHIKRHHLSDAKVVVPPIESNGLLESLTSVIQPLLDLAISNGLESRTLAETRDSLLPKLLSGELRVSIDADDSATAVPQQGDAACV